jgi:hypothetical protein
MYSYFSMQIAADELPRALARLALPIAPSFEARLSSTRRAAVPTREGSRSDRRCGASRGSPTGGVFADGSAVIAQAERPRFAASKAGRQIRRNRR